MILPPALRTRSLDARLPQYQLGALQVLAEDGGESVEAMLMRMVEELIDFMASASLEEHGFAIGFEERATLLRSSG